MSRARVNTPASCGHGPAYKEGACRQCWLGMQIPPPPVYRELSPREQEVVEYAGMGMTNKQIGAALFMGEQTVKNHMSSVLRKTGAHDRAEAAVMWDRKVDTPAAVYERTVSELHRSVHDVVLALLEMTTAMRAVRDEVRRLQDLPEATPDAD